MAAWLDWFFPPQCALCAQSGSEAICEACLGEMPPASPLFFPELNVVFALHAYESRARQAVKRLKFESITSLAQPMAAAMAEAYIGGRVGEHDAIIPVPIHWTRRASRGFNQSEFLCQNLPEDKVKSELLYRTRRTRPQVGLNPKDRQANMIGAFAVTEDLTGQSILLVDDVVTTGSTARSCARALRSAGAERISLLCWCGGRQESELAPNSKSKFEASEPED